MTESVLGRRWRVRPRPAIDAGMLRAFPPLTALLLTQRGVSTPDDARAFLQGGAPAPDPDALPGMPAAVGILIDAIRTRRRVAVFGDYDVDGVTATAILSSGLRELGADVITRLPNRFVDGYGLTVGGITALKQAGADLLVSVDCGITANREIDFAVDSGLDVVVLDHHEPPLLLPNAAAIVDPKLGGGPPAFDALAACGLAYAAVRALFAAAGRPHDPERDLDLAALGTVADMVPLTGENRRIVRDGLALLRNARRPGVRALMRVAGVDPARATAESISFRLAPRLNAAGRLDDAALALDLLTTADGERAEALAIRLSELNAARQKMTADGLALARDLIRTAGRDADSAIVTGHAEIAKGVVGLVAGKLTEERYRPSAVYHIDADGLCHGSVRGIPEVSVVEGLSRAGHLMKRWGGHAQAGGFTAPFDQMPEIARLIRAWADEHLSGKDLLPTIDADAELKLDRVRRADWEMIAGFAPHGQANPTPVFISRGFIVHRARTIGADGRHLRLTLSHGGVRWDAVAFGMGHAPPPPGARLDAVYSVVPDLRGTGLELQLADFMVA